MLQCFEWLKLKLPTCLDNNLWTQIFYFVHFIVYQMKIVLLKKKLKKKTL